MIIGKKTLTKLNRKIKIGTRNVIKRKKNWRSWQYKSSTFLLSKAGKKLSKNRQTVLTDKYLLHFCLLGIGYGLSVLGQVPLS